MERTISLLYHDVVPVGANASSGFNSADADRYKLVEPQFVAHLAAIAARVRPGPQLFTFDDGGASARRAGHLLAERGWRGLFFVPTNFIGMEGFVTPADIRALAGDGHVIGSHSCSHPLRMTALSRQRLLQEWTESRKILENILGQSVPAASIPGGYYSAGVADTAEEAGYRELFTSEPLATPWRVGDLRVHGRYSVRQSSRARLVAALAAGDRLPRMQQFAYWNLKKLLKRAGGDHWLRFRKSYLGLRTQ